MINEFLTKAQENLTAAALLFEHELYNASANRAYYATFQAAIAALANIGIHTNRSHEATQAQFASKLIKRRKVYPSHLKSYLMDLQKVRDFADYKEYSISKKEAGRQLKKATEFVSMIIETVQTG
jgi:uncharacterized protein (UPF0332 family)